MNQSDFIEEAGNEWVLLNRERTKVLGRFPTREAAEQREREIEFFRKKDNAEFTKQLAQEKVTPKKGSRKRKLSKPLSPSSLRSLERRYTSELLKILNIQAQAIREVLIPRLKEFEEESKAQRGTLDSKEVRLDNVADKIKRTFEILKATIDSRISDQELEQIAQSTGNAVESKNKFNVNKVMKSVLGVAVADVLSEPYLIDELGFFTINNVNLIKDMNSTFIGDVEQVVMQGMRQGIRAESIQKQILGLADGSPDFVGKSRFRTAKSRAKVIARDQVNKFNGELTKIRQQNLGVGRYIWRTVGDDRVRPTHQGFNGNVFTWEEGSPEGNPGEPINCRCYAEPILQDLLE